MVTVKVFFEGGANPLSNPDVATVDNTNRLRESFNKLLNSGFEEEKVKIQAEPAYSITNVVKIREPNSLLLIDLDGTVDKKAQRIKDNQLLDVQDFVFFMVQMMEAWILSQPEIIEKVFEYYKIGEAAVKDDDRIFHKDIESIKQPDEVLKIILQRYFVIEKAGKTKKLKYGKLKHAPDLIQNLDIQKLREVFNDVKLMLLKIEEISR
jgi:Domain of unknown function (DUF4276)